MDSLDALFWDIDEFCQQFESSWNQQLIAHTQRCRHRSRAMSLSEVMTILVAFHQQSYRTFKDFYLKHVCVYWREAFPTLVSYNRFIEWIPTTIIALCVYLKSQFGQCSGISFIDATSLKVCHNRRIQRHRVFNGLAKRGKTSVDWFFGFKLHLVVSEYGELLNITLTPGNTDDRVPVVDLLKRLWGKVFADRGYVKAALSEELLGAYGIEFFAKPRRNMKNHLMRWTDKLLARKRAIIETIIDQLKNISQIEHSRHRSPVNFLANVLCGLIAYCRQDKKPALNLDFALPQAA